MMVVGSVLASSKGNTNTSPIDREHALVTCIVIGFCFEQLLGGAVSLTSALGSSLFSPCWFRLWPQTPKRPKWALCFF